MPFNWLPQSAEPKQILKQKPARLPAHNLKGYGALIEPSEFDWSEAKLSCYGRDSCAGVGMAPTTPLPATPRNFPTVQVWDFFLSFLDTDECCRRL